MTDLEKHGYFVGYLRKTAEQPAPQPQQAQPQQMQQPMSPEEMQASNERMKNLQRKAAIAEKALLQANAEKEMEQVKQKSLKVDEKAQKELAKADQATQQAIQQQQQEQMAQAQAQQQAQITSGPGSLGIPAPRQQQQQQMQQQQPQQMGGMA